MPYSARCCCRSDHPAPVTVPGRYPVVGFTGSVDCLPVSLGDNQTPALHSDKCRYFVFADLGPLRIRLQEAKLRLDFASNFLHEIQGDSAVGPEHDDALARALRAVAEAKVAYEQISERLTDAMKEQSRARGA